MVGESEGLLVPDSIPTVAAAQPHPSLALLSLVQKPLVAVEPLVQLPPAGEGLLPFPAEARRQWTA